MLPISNPAHLVVLTRRNIGPAHDPCLENFPNEDATNLTSAPIGGSIFAPVRPCADIRSLADVGARVRQSVLQFQAGQINRRSPTWTFPYMSVR